MTQDVAPVASSAASVQQQITQLLPFLRSLGLRLTRNFADAEDLVQETVMRAMSAIHRFQPNTNLKAWLACIMRNLFRTASKRNRREPNLGIEDPSWLGCVAPDQEWKLMAREVSNFVDAMDWGRRTALLMVAGGVSYEDTAKELRCQVGTIKSRVNRARSALAAEFGSFDVRALEAAVQ